MTDRAQEMENRAMQTRYPIARGTMPLLVEADGDTERSLGALLAWAAEHRSLLDEWLGISSSWNRIRLPSHIHH